MLEELSRADAGLGVTLAVHTGAGTLPIVAHGTEDQRLRLVPPLAQGHELAAFALTEPESGSDAAAMRATADEQDRLTGTKQWITNGSHAHVFTVFARDARAGGRPSAFVVRRGADGFRAVREEEKLGLHSSSTADLAFEGTPAELLGARGAGMRIALATLDGGRIGIAAQAVGIAQAALDVAVAYAKERRTFGVPIGAHQAIQQKLADMSTEVEAARALTWRAARAKEAGARTRSRARRPSSSPPASRGASPARRSRSSAAPATRASSRPSASTATPRSPRSTRARARSSARHRPRAARRRRAGHRRLSRPRRRPGGGRPLGGGQAAPADAGPPTPRRRAATWAAARRRGRLAAMNPSLIGIAHAKAHQPFPRRAGPTGRAGRAAAASATARPPGARHAQHPPPDAVHTFAPPDGPARPPAARGDPRRPHLVAAAPAPASRPARVPASGA